MARHHKLVKNSKAAIFAIFYFLPKTVLAQPGISDFYQVEQQVNRWYFDFSDLVLSIGAIAGLLGGLRIYNNWQTGNPRIDSQVAGWFFSCLFLSILSTALRALYGIN